MSLPFAVWTVDSVCSLYTVRGTSMEPSFRDGDVLVVRKVDILPMVPIGSSEEDVASRARILRAEGHQHSILFARPPMVLPGQVIVFCSPKTAFPNEYHIKRVIGVGGQMVRGMKRSLRLVSIQYTTRMLTIFSVDTAWESLS
jgi:signal peptidase I